MSTNEISAREVETYVRRLEEQVNGAMIELAECLTGKRPVMGRKHHIKKAIQSLSVLRAELDEMRRHYDLGQIPF